MESEILNDAFGNGYSICVIKVDSVKDKRYIDNWIEEAEKQVMNNNDPAGNERERQKQIITRYMGTASEKIVKAVLKNSIKEVNFERPKFDGHGSHVDIVASSGDKKCKIEVRSSFPRKSLEWALFDKGGFDIIGNYTTVSKSIEIWKDIYIRVLFKMTDNVNCGGNNFDPRQTHYVYIVGSADKELFSDIGYDGDLKQSGARYKLIKPISNGYDYNRTLDKIKEKLE